MSFPLQIPTYTAELRTLSLLLSDGSEMISSKNFSTQGSLGRPTPFLFFGNTQNSRLRRRSEETGKILG